MLRLGFLAVQLPAAAAGGQGGTASPEQRRRPAVAEVVANAAGITLTYDPTAIAAALVGISPAALMSCLSDSLMLLLHPA